MRRPIIAVVVAIVLFSIPQLSMGLMRALTVKDLTGNSDVVIRGTVEKMESFWTGEDSRRTIVTRGIVSVSEIIAGGPSGDKVIVQYEGGQVGDLVLKVSDMPVITAGEEVILFLKKTGADGGDDGPFSEGTIYFIKGLGQGKYSLGRDGLARKNGFSNSGGAEDKTDRTIRTDRLIEKIRSAK